MTDGISRAQVQRLIENGFVTLNGERAMKPAAKLASGDTVEVLIPPPKSPEAAPEEIPLDIVFQDADICIVNKPAGLVVHPAHGHESGTLVNALLHHVKDLSGVGGVAKPGIVHRLDKGTSGLMVVCKNDRAHTELARQFAGREVKKIYLAIVYGSPRTSEGVFDTLYGRNPSDRMKYSSKVMFGKRALTRWRVIHKYEGYTLVEVELLTGRTHQIRVHFSDNGMPLIGDLVYGAQRRARSLKSAAAQRLAQSGERVMLHAARISFTHPATGKKVEFSAPMPEDMKILTGEI
jgi:23S rRNA pseudouridine1911/1915/1917 synthase